MANGNGHWRSHTVTRNGKTFARKGHQRPVSATSMLGNANDKLWKLPSLAMKRMNERRAKAALAKRSNAPRPTKAKYALTAVGQGAAGSVAAIGVTAIAAPIILPAVAAVAVGATAYAGVQAARSADQASASESWWRRQARENGSRAWSRLQAERRLLKNWAQHQNAASKRARSNGSHGPKASSASAQNTDTSSILSPGAEAQGARSASESEHPRDWKPRPTAATPTASTSPEPPRKFKPLRDSNDPLFSWDPEIRQDARDERDAQNRKRRAKKTSTEKQVDDEKIWRAARKADWGSFEQERFVDIGWKINRDLRAQNPTPAAKSGDPIIVGNRKTPRSEPLTLEELQSEAEAKNGLRPGSLTEKRRARKQKSAVAAS